MATLNFVKKARKDYPEYNIKKGDSYYWWEFRYGGVHKSKEKPRRSQLTQSSFLATLWDIEDTIQNFYPEWNEYPENFKDDIVSQIEELKNTCEENLDNIPEQLQEASAGQLLQERIDALENWINDLESIDYDIDESTFREEAEQEVEDEEIKDDQEKKDRIEEVFKEKMQQRVDEIVDEIKGMDSGL